MHEPEQLRVALMQDPRWALCSIKTISLMGNILCMLQAHEHGADEAILHRGEQVGEGSHTNIFLVRDDAVATTPIDDAPPILHGVTREMVMRAARAMGREVEVRPIPVAELHEASELFVTSSRKIVAGVTALDGRPFGNGSSGPVTRALFNMCCRLIAEQTGAALPEAAVAGALR
jgi:D-alanine transaminase